MERQVKERFSNEVIAELLRLKWWDLPDENIKMIIPYLQAEPCVKIIMSLIKQFRTNDEFA